MKPHSRLLPLTLIACLLAARPLFAAADAPAPDPTGARRLYVGLQGNDGNDGHTPATALRTPQKAADRSEPGDVILFTTGEYLTEGGKALLSIRRSGLPGKPIIYAPAPGAKVIFRNETAWEAIKVTGARHIQILGFRVIGVAKQVTLEEAKREMDNLKNSRTCQNGIAVDHDPATKTPAAFITIRNCVVSDCSGGGIYANHSDYLTFELNIVLSCAFWSPYGNSGISVYQPIDVDQQTGYKIIIRNNVSAGNYQNIPFYFSNRDEPEKRKVTDGNGIIIDDYLNSQHWGGGSGKPYGGRTLVANNIVIGNGGSGIHSYKSLNVDIVHNYAAGNNRHPALKDGQIFANTSKNARIINNIMVAPPGKPVTTSYKNENLILDHNLYASLDAKPAIFEGPKAKNLLAAPGLELTGWEQGQMGFKAAPTSPLRGAGQPLTEPVPDFFGKPRHAATPDIGPFVLDPH